MNDDPRDYARKRLVQAIEDARNGNTYRRGGDITKWALAVLALSLSEPPSEPTAAERRSPTLSVPLGDTGFG